MNKIRAFIINNWLEAGIGTVLLLSPLLRFSWDLWAQTALHCAVISLIALFIMLYRQRWSVFSFSLAGVFIAASMTLMVSTNRATTRNELMILFDALAVAWLFAQLPSEKKYKLIIIPCLAGVWFSSILLFYFLKDPIAYFCANQLQIDPLVNLNVVAGYLLLALGASMLFVAPLNKQTYVPPFFIMAGIILTQSRGAILFGGAQLVAFAAFNKIISRKSLIACALLIVCLIVTITLLKARADGGLIFLITDRLGWWQTAIRAFFDSPFLGHGWGNFSGISSFYTQGKGLNSLYCHCLPLQIAAESGIIGVAAAGFFLTVALRQNAHVRALALAICAFLGQNLFDFSFYISGVMLLFFVLCAYSFEQNPIRRTASPAAIALIAIAAACALIYSVQPLRASRDYQHAIYLINQGATVEADKALDAAQHIDPIDSQIYAKRAEIAFAAYSLRKDNAKLKNAIAFQQQAIKLFATNAPLWADLAWLMAVEGNKEGALSAVSQAIRLDRYNENFKAIQRAVLSGKTDKTE